MITKVRHWGQERRRSQGWGSQGDPGGKEGTTLIVPAAEVSSRSPEEQFQSQQQVQQEIIPAPTPGRCQAQLPVIPE